MNAAFSLEGRTVLISGASAGIGAQCAVTCSQMGARVVLLGRNEGRLQEVQRRMAGGPHPIVIQDVTEYARLGDRVAEAVAAVGPLSGFVHAAGVEIVFPLRLMTAEHYQQLFATNVVAGFELAKHVASRRSVDPRGASLVFISSVMGLVGTPGKVGYCSTKGALIAGVRALALELASQKVRANAISPGVVRTGMSERMFAKVPAEAREEIVRMHALGCGEPEDVANACAFLLSDAARWITGTNLVVDGGYTAK